MTDSAATPRTATAKASSIVVNPAGAPRGSSGGFGWLTLLPLLGVGLLRRRA